VPASACCAYRRRRAAFPEGRRGRGVGGGGTASSAVRVPASGVPIYCVYHCTPGQWLRICVGLGFLLPRRGWTCVPAPHAHHAGPHAPCHARAYAPGHARSHASPGGETRPCRSRSRRMGGAARAGREHAILGAECAHVEERHAAAAAAAAAAHRRRGRAGQRSASKPWRRRRWSTTLAAPAARLRAASAGPAPHRGGRGAVRHQPQPGGNGRRLAGLRRRAAGRYSSPLAGEGGATGRCFPSPAGEGAAARRGGCRALRHRPESASAAGRALQQRRHPAAGGRLT